MYPQVFGKYILERELGRGGMARILLATLRGAGGFEKKLVVKQIRDELLVDGEFVRRFVEEAKTTVALSHPNIVPVYELGVEQGTYFLAMELVEGLSLDQLLRHEAQGGERNKLFPEEGAYIGVEVCRALSYAHRRMKVVHRDITPRNVMIDEEGQVKLIDFGIAAPARVVGQEIFGSPGHMPPEQMAGRELGPPTDIFAVAALLMEAWSGSPPFRRKTMEECDAAMRAPHPRPSETDPRLLPLDETMLRAMSLDPKERQQDADELGRSFRHFLTGIDLADVARTLGARVYHARKSMNLDKSEEPTREKSGRAPSQAEVYTQTFAAREEVDHWSVRPESGAQGDAGGGAAALAQGTRRIPQSTPPFPVTRPIREESEPPPSSRADARAPADDPDKTAPRAAARIGGEDAVVETIATRPIETPVRPWNSIAPKARAAGRRGMLQGAAVAAVAVAALWFFVVRANNASSTLPTLPEARDAGLAGASASAPSMSSSPIGSAPLTGPRASPSGDPQPPGSVTTSRPPPQGSGANGAGTSSAGVTGTAELVLFGSPGTRVQVDGAAARRCPARLTTTSGSHDIRFLFDQTGESRGERITLKPGEHVTLRADFTQAVPTIQINH